MHIAAKIGLGLIIASGVGAGIYFGFVKKDADGKTWLDRMTKTKEGAHESAADKEELIRLILINKELLGPMGESQASKEVFSKYSLQELQKTIDEMKATAKNSPGMAFRTTPQSSVASDTLNKSFTPTANDSFPLSKGMRGPLVAKMQTALINKFSIGIGGGADGGFGNKTIAALATAGYDVPVSESDYNDILAGKKKGASQAPSGNTTTLNSGDSIYAKNDGTPIYSYPESNSKYIITDSNNNPFKFNKSTVPMGTFTKNAGATGFIEANVKNHGKVYVKASQIKSSAY